MLRKLLITALFAASFTACLNDNTPKTNSADGLSSSESIPPSLYDTTASASAEATRSVSDRESMAAQNDRDETSKAEKIAARKAANQAAKKKAAEDAQKNKKSKADNPKIPTKSVTTAPKTDKKGGKPAKEIGSTIPVGTDKVKKRDGRDDVFVRSEVVPTYAGGEAAMIKYLQKNLRYPVVAKENGIKGTVFVQFVVEKDGLVDDVTVVKGVDKYLDTEAKRVVSAMPKWSAGQQNGKAVAVQYVLPVKFELVE
ncbi:MAG: energy transducer TonB [Saprospiraceae bacterium]|nr:energy transducer TonB [Saprospiraceae bacterium]